VCAYADRCSVSQNRCHVRAREHRRRRREHSRSVPYRGADCGYVTVALLVDADEESRTVLGTPRRLRPALVETTLSASSSGYSVVEHAVSTGRQAAHEPLPSRVCFDEPQSAEPFGAVDAELLYRLACQSVEPKPDTETDPGFVVACIDPNHPRYSVEAGQVVDRSIREEETLRPPLPAGRKSKLRQSARPRGR